MGNEFGMDIEHLTELLCLSGIFTGDDIDVFEDFQLLGVSFPEGCQWVWRRCIELELLSRMIWRFINSPSFHSHGNLGRKSPDFFVLGEGQGLGDNIEVSDSIAIAFEFNECILLRESLFRVSIVVIFKLETTFEFATLA